MPGTYLTDLAWVLRSAGLTVIEEPGWQSRGRKSGGFAPGRPTHAMIHHTASPPSSDGQRDVDYIVKGSPDAPICNVYFNRAGTVWACAAGATNTNGLGVDTWGGGVPNDKMNEFAIGFEIANTGVGEPYPQAQQDAVMVATIALCRHYRIPSEFVRAHFEWAPTRKIDPTGPSRWAPNGGKWNMTAFRTEVRLGIIGPPQPPDPDPSEDTDMMALDFDQPGQPTTVLTWDGIFLAWVENGNADQVLRAAGVKRIAVNREQVKGAILASKTTTREPFTLDGELVNLWRGRAL